MADKPLIPTMIRTEFGDVLESEAFQALNGPAGDYTYVPGYSDMRRTRDQQLKEVADGERQSKDVLTLPVRLQWVRHAHYSGRPDNTKPIEFGNDKYRAVTTADIGQPWCTGMPPHATEGPGGQIRTEDCTLMVIDANGAAQKAAAIRLQTDLMTRHDSVAGKLMELGRAKPGSDPTLEVKTGEQIRVGSSIKAK